MVWPSGVYEQVGSKVMAELCLLGLMANIKPVEVSEEDFAGLKYSQEASSDWHVSVSLEHAAKLLSVHGRQ